MLPREKFELPDQNKRNKEYQGNNQRRNKQDKQ